MESKNVMDQLALDAAAARRAGMSYGKYMAMRPKREKATETQPEVIQEGRYCRTCGALIPKDSRRRFFCSTKCVDGYNFRPKRPAVPKKKAYEESHRTEGA